MMRPTQLYAGSLFVLFLIATAPIDLQAQERRAEINQLLERIEPLSYAAKSDTEESPRLRVTDRGFVKTLGTPPNHHIPLLSSQAAPEDVAAQFMAGAAAELGFNDQSITFSVQKVEQKDRYSYVRLQQEIAGIPVYAGEVIVQTSSEGGVQFINTDAIQTAGAENLNSEPQNSGEQAIQSAREFLIGRSVLSSEDVGVKSNAELRFFAPTVVGLEGTPELAWYVQFASEEGGLMYSVLVSASSREVLFSNPERPHALDRRIYDAEISHDHNKSTLREEGDNPSGDEEGDDLYDFIGDTYRFYENKHGRNSYDDNGGEVRATINYCFEDKDGNVDCTIDNAKAGSRPAWGVFNKEPWLLFSEGMVVDDVVAHEYTHLVTNYTSGLVYRNESGAINESFSDIWGELIDIQNGTSQPWKIGEGSVAGSIRDMSSPLVPEMSSPFWKESCFLGLCNDNGGVHRNSGVGNKLAYLLIEGGKHNDYQVNSIGTLRTINLFYEVQTGLLSSGAEYSDLYYTLTQAAINLQWNADERRELEKASRSVGIVHGKLLVNEAGFKVNETKSLTIQYVAPDKDDYKVTVTNADGSTPLNWEWGPSGIIRSDGTIDSGLQEVDEYDIQAFKPNLTPKDVSESFLITLYKETLLGLQIKDQREITIVAKNDNSCALTADITNLEARLSGQNPVEAPRVFASVEVQGNQNPVPQLSPVDFGISENGKGIGDFVLSQPSQGGARLADIVFIVDNSGSMGPEQADVQSNIRSFVDALVANNVDFQLGLVRYGQSNNRGKPILEDNGTLTTDADYFKNQVLARNITNGGNEPGYFAITEAARSFAFRTGSQKIFIVATDEPPNQGFSSQSDALNALTNSNISLYASVPSGLNSYFRPLADDTDGQIYDIQEDFSSLASAIASQVSNSYIAAYTSPTTYTGGSVASREVDITIAGQNCTITATESYKPGNVPRVAPTTTTLNLGNKGQPNNQQLKILAEVVTLSGPAVQAVRLFYRPLGAPTFVSILMQLVTNNTSAKVINSPSKAASLYEANIPAPDVKAPGVEYYITASDGQSTISIPSRDPQGNPLQVAVLPNEPPQIGHSTPQTVLPGKDLMVTATAADNTNSLAAVKLFYRQKGQITYSELAMSRASGDTYSATIPGGQVSTAGLEYYIEATDDQGVTNTEGTADYPLTVTPSAPCVASDFNEVFNGSERQVEINLEDENGIESASFTDDQGNPLLNNLNVLLVSATNANGASVSFTRDNPGDDIFWSAGDPNNLPAQIVMHLKQADQSVAEAGYYLRATNGCGTTTVIDPPHNFAMDVTPKEFSLDGNYPNPFTNQTTFQVGLPEREHVTLTVYDVMGRRVATVLNKAVPAGTHQITWQGQSNGQPLSSGIYFYRIKAGDFVQTRRMTLVR